MGHDEIVTLVSVEHGLNLPDDVVELQTRPRFDVVQLNVSNAPGWFVEDGSWCSLRRDRGNESTKYGFEERTAIKFHSGDS